MGNSIVGKGTRGKTPFYRKKAPRNDFTLSFYEESIIESRPCKNL